MIIRAASSDDGPQIAAIYAPIVTATAISFEDIAPSAEDMAGRIRATMDAGYPYLVATRDSAVVGYVYASQHRSRAAYRHSVDVTAYVAPTEQRTGVGTALYRELLAELAGRGFHAAFAGIALPNEASVALHERAGFTHVGIYREVGFKFGRWHDVGWWQRRL